MGTAFGVSIEKILNCLSVFFIPPR